MRLTSTYFGANGWLLEFGSLKILVDPWLIGELTFPIGSFFLKGQLPEEREIPKDIDLLLLTQGLEDHCHLETLTSISRHIPTIGSPSAVRVLEKLGYINIKMLSPGEQTNFRGLTIIATAGAPVPNTENGYLIRNDAFSVYLEPHGFLDKSIKPQHVDVVITPVIDVGIKFLGSFIRGSKVLNEIIELFDPSYIIPSTTGGDIKFNGLINNFIYQKGSISQVKKELPPSISLIEIKAGSKFQLDFKLINNSKIIKRNRLID